MMTLSFPIGGRVDISSHEAFLIDIVRCCHSSDFGITTLCKVLRVLFEKFFEILAEEVRAVEISTESRATLCKQNRGRPDVVIINIRNSRRDTDARQNVIRARANQAHYHNRNSVIYPAIDVVNYWGSTPP